MSHEWEKLKHVEKTRKIMTKSNPGTYQTFTNVTHIYIRPSGPMIKCDQGIVYFSKDDISHIITECEDWTV